MRKLALTLLTGLLAALSGTLAAAPSGYSINSDSPTGNADSLYRIDLGTGAETRIAPVKSLGQTLSDVEGLAFAPDGTLYGMDDDTLTLFPLNPDNAVVDSSGHVLIKGLPIGGGNDFGMTFACDGTLYVTSLTTRSLYTMSLNGNATRIGNAGSLGVNISAIAAYGNPVKLYGLGNGLRLLPDETFVTDVPNLYEINPQTGVAALIGPLGAAAQPYFQGGLSFDDAGQLWAITDRRQPFSDLPSEVMKIDTATGTASAVKSLSEIGFESLAVTVPRGCSGNNNSEVATFTVQKQFVDGNDETPATLRIRCQTGLPLEQSFTVMPNPGALGDPEVEFTVDNFEDGALNCDVYETDPANYSGSYECFSEGACSTTATACSFTGVSGGQENLCVIRNYPDPVTVTVAAEWLFNSEDLVDSGFISVDLLCRNVHDGDGFLSGDTMIWSWLLNSNSAPVSGTVYPRFDGGTECRTEVSSPNSAIEFASDCADWTPVALGDGALTCTITNTVFFEGIPTLSPLGLALAAMLLLGTGLIATRRLH
jgi:hypothetical protein